MRPLFIPQLKRATKFSARWKQFFTEPLRAKRVCPADFVGVVRVKIMWFPAEQEAIEIFAAHFEARHRSGAVGKAKDIARRLRSKGDEEGYCVWERVAERVREVRETRSGPYSATLIG